MDSDTLVSLIRTHGTERLAKAVDSITEQIREGWNLTNWQTRGVGGALLFYRVKDRAITDEPRVLCVHADESERQRWEQIARESSDAPVTVLLESGAIDRPRQTRR